jgi:hypothetical protein
MPNAKIVCYARIVERFSGRASGRPYLFQKSFLMRTEKQIAASRLNGRRSSGATTSEGKVRIVAANLKSGLYAESEILPWEDAQSLDRLEAQYYGHHRPASPEARLLLDDLILCEWTLRRLHRADSNLWAYSAKKAWQPDPDYAPVQAFRYSKDLQRLEAQSEAVLARTCPNASAPTPGNLSPAPSPNPWPGKSFPRNALTRPWESP